jgi:hypothetical protein
VQGTGPVPGGQPTGAHHLEEPTSSQKFASLATFSGCFDFEGAPASARAASPQFPRVVPPLFDFLAMATASTAEPFWAQPMTGATMHDRFQDTTESGPWQLRLSDGEAPQEEPGASALVEDVPGVSAPLVATPDYVALAEALLEEFPADEGGE